MHWQKFQASRLFDGYCFRQDGSVLITDARGVVEAIVPAADAGDDIRYFEGLLCPGFVNAHCHLELSHLKGMIPRHTGMIDFLLAVIRLRGFAPAVIQEAMAMAMAAMQENGIVAVGDICNTADSVAIKQHSSIQWQNFIEVTGFVGSAAGERFSAAQEVLRLFDAALPGRNVIVPHAPYSVSPSLFSLVNDAAMGRVLSIHSQESVAENQFYLDRTGDFLRLYNTLGIDISFFTPPGSTSLAACLPRLDKACRIILVHNVAFEEEDLAFVPSSAFFCLCPNANQYIQQTLPPIGLLQRSEAGICLGTDSLASNDGLSILAEIQTLLVYYPGLDHATVLRWATLNGAEALDMADTLGSFEKGRLPGVVLVEGDLAGSTTVRRII